MTAGPADAAAASPPPGVRLRPAVGGDLEQMAAAELALFPGEAWSPAQLAEEISHPSRRYVVALVEPPSTPGPPALVPAAPVLIGYAGIMLAGDTADLHTIGTLRPGQGIGRALLAWCEEQARAGGAQRMLLEVREDNRRARAVYARAGYEEIGVRRGYYRIGTRSIDAILMRRELRGPAPASA
ncbi:GNAT family N-acetyltransferase [Brachybacterium hainanense]|uniref:GNAT family N-acetyltransferase n=1 Tax=Brachybacterium hainanense TaxID=1541174 RepID=A0ABV6R7V4_9MICO